MNIVIYGHRLMLLKRTWIFDIIFNIEIPSFYDNVFSDIEMSFGELCHRLLTLFVDKRAFLRKIHLQLNVKTFIRDNKISLMNFERR